jgi:limonene 1,2-monooxygenase
MAWHIAETREQARNEAVLGLQRWNNEYNSRILGRPGANHVEDAWALLDQVTGQGAAGVGAAVVGTPDDLIAAIRTMQEVTGGFGVVLGFAHDWANREATLRSWELVARYVVPALHGTVLPLQASADYVEANKVALIAGASAAVMQKIMAHEGAQAALVTTMKQMAEQASKRESAFRPGGGIPTAEATPDA